MRFDPNEPFGEVFGIPGVKYTQHNRLYGLNGHEVRVVDEPPDAESGEVRRHAEAIDLDDGEVLVKPEATSSNDFESMHWTALKAMVESYGGEWSNKADAIKFLRG